MLLPSREATSLRSAHANGVAALQYIVTDAIVRESPSHARRTHGASENTGVLVTGASRGLGLELSRALAREGARVVMVARERARSRRRRARREGRRGDGAQGGEAHALASDVGDKEAVHRIAGAAAALVGDDRRRRPQREHARAGADAAPARHRLRGPRARARGEPRRPVPAHEGRSPARWCCAGAGSSCT